MEIYLFYNILIVLVKFLHTGQVGNIWGVPAKMSKMPKISFLSQKKNACPRKKCLS